MIDPVAFSQEYGRDALLLYLFTAFPIGEDGDFDQKQVAILSNAKLSNNLGNLLNRAIALTLKIGGNLPKNEKIIPIGDDFISEYHDLMTRYDLKAALDNAFEYASLINKYVDETTPWKLDAETQKNELSEILYNLVYHLRRVALMLLPFFEEKMNELLSRIGTPFDENMLITEELQKIPENFIIIEKGKPLYMRINIE